MRRVVLPLLVAAAALAGPTAASARDLPRSFQFGVAIAGFQTEMGRGQDLDRRTDWWRWTHDAKNIASGIVTDDEPERGPGFLRRYAEDARIAARELDLQAFRLGLEWSRIFPRSTAGATTLKQLDRLADQRAVTRYRSVLRAIRREGMRPWVTLNHFTLPSWLHDPIEARDAFAGRDPDAPLPALQRGGWLEERSVAEFRKYADYAAWRFGDLVDDWITLNEPMVVAVSGYANIPGVLQGGFPPGVFSWPAVLTVVERMADANAAGYDAVKRRDTGPTRPARVGVVHNMVAFTPSDPARPADVASTANAEYLFDRLFLDAVIKGVRDRDADGVVDPGEQTSKRGKADVIGLNYYFRGRVSALGSPLTQRIQKLDFLPRTSYKAGECPTTCTDFGWEVYPEGFRQVLKIAGSYGKPVVVTENGISDADDDQRATYIRDHLRQLVAARRAKEVDVRGYFAWSLTDNFEWAHGYEQRFGFYRYDPVTLKRTARPSARAYARIARTGVVG